MIEAKQILYFWQISFSLSHLIGQFTVRRVYNWDGYTTENFIDSSRNIQLIEIITKDFHGSRPSETINNRDHLQR